MIFVQTPAKHLRSWAFVLWIESISLRQNNGILLLAVPRGMGKIRLMLGWVSKVMFARQVRGRRRRELRFLLLALLLGFLVCGAIVGLFYVLNAQTPQ